MSNIFSDLVLDRAPPAKYLLNGKVYTVGYYLADGIYQNWSTIVKTISQPRGEKFKYFAKQQQAARKDVERAFGVLQARFAIVGGPVRNFDKQDLKYIMYACIIMYNMIVENELDMYKAVERENYYVMEEAVVSNNSPLEMSRDVNNDLFNSFMEAHYRNRDKRAHFQLKKEFIKHLWNFHGMSN